MPVSGSRAPTSRQDNNIDPSQTRDVRRDSTNKSSRSDSSPRSTDNSGMQAGSAADLVEASSSSEFMQQVAEAANLNLPFVPFTNASGQTVFFTLNQLQNAGLLPNPNNPPSAEGEVPEPFVSAQGDNSGFGTSRHTLSEGLGRTVSENTTGRGAYDPNNPRSINPNQNNSFDWVSQNTRMWQGLTQSNQMDDQIQETKQKAQEADKAFVKIKQIALMVMMGDYVGALRAMTNEQEAYTKQIAREYLTQMNKSKDVKAMLAKTMANYAPPMNTGSTDPQTIANFQNKQAKYSQVMGLMTNTLQEVSTSDRQLTDGYTEVIRKLTESYETLSNVTEINSRAMKAITRG
ncbi:MAG: hypothetical protein HQM15_10100 [Deltaproteobacteria bacterium]|nr:hypothetical protein [Deltaproteobacteria bacterium]